MPPDRVEPSADLLLSGEETYSHESLLDATEQVVADTDMTDEDAVAVESSLTQPGTLVAGVLAPLSVRARILLPGADQTATVAVTDDAPESRSISPSTVL
jgi:hypothetical protein